MSTLTSEILRAARILFRPESVVEIRVPNAGRQRVISGYFTDQQKLAAAAASLDKSRFAGVYWTLNPVNRDLLARADHRLESFARYTAADPDIVERAWLPIDFDPVRPAGISSTDDEKQAALDAASRAGEWLTSLGWPQALFADSGNGWHRVHRIALPNDPESADLVHRVLLALAARFNNERVKIDVGIANAARIFKVWGTMARKGDHTAERPHRLSRLIDAPDPLDVVPIELVRHVAEMAPVTISQSRHPRKAPAARPGAFDIERFLIEHGVRYRGPVAHTGNGGGRKFVLEECPWDPTHKDPDAAVFEFSDGSYGFHCFHNSCSDRVWRDFREFFDPDAPRGPRASAPREEAPSPAVDTCDEAPLNVSDVEAAIDVAATLADALRLLPEIARVPAHVQTLIKAKLRGRFKGEFSGRDFDRGLKDLVMQRDAPPAPPDEDDEGEDEDTPDLTRQPLTDSGNGERLVALYGKDMRFCIEFDKWLRWDGRRWQIDEAEEVTQWAKRMARVLYRQARGKPLQAELQTHARASESQASIANMLKRAATEPGIPIHATELDQHSYLLNCRNGVVDVRTGELVKHDRGYLITKLCNTDYKPDAPRPTLFLSFVWWAMGAPWETAHNEDAELPERTVRLVDFLQKGFGYALTADVGEKAAFIFYGRKGNNGKTTLLTIITSLLADYSTKIDINTLMQGKATDNNVRADLARLHGVRLAMTTELDDQQRLSERLFKELAAGMGDITACRKFENPFQFKATHKMFVDGNHRPVIRGTDDAIWQRLRCVPFDSHLDDDDPRMDRKLKDKILSQESEGVLAWMVRGAMRWAKEGLGVPIDVKETNEAWRRSDDPLREFLDECCEFGSPDDGYWIQRKTLSTMYRAWCKENGENFPLSRKHFTERIESKGVYESRSRRDLAGMQMRTWEGLRLNPDVTLPAAHSAGARED